MSHDHIYVWKWLFLISCPFLMNLISCPLPLLSCWNYGSKWTDVSKINICREKILFKWNMHGKLRTYKHDTNPFCPIFPTFSPILIELLELTFSHLLMDSCTNPFVPFYSIHDRKLMKELNIYIYIYLQKAQYSFPYYI